MTNKELIQISILFAIVPFLGIAVAWLFSYFNNRTYVLSQSDISSDKRFDKWLKHFDAQVLKTKSKGDKALANPFDNCEAGIPNSSELEVLRRMLLSGGYGAYINYSFPPDKLHLTVYWN